MQKILHEPLDVNGYLAVCRGGWPGPKGKKGLGPKWQKVYMLFEFDKAECVGHTAGTGDGKNPSPSNTGMKFPTT